MQTAATAVRRPDATNARILVLATGLPEDSAAYTTYDTDGKTITKEYCSFSGSSEVDGAPHTWSAVLSYDYSMANASGNLADTVRTIFVYVNS